MNWSPDGSQILFGNDRNGPRDLYLKAASGATPEEPIYQSSAMFKDPRAWSPDGRFIVFDELNPKTNRDIWVMPVDGDRKPKLYLQTPFNEEAGTISPDGRWMAYSSDESGHLEVYVDSFPTPRRKYKVTSTGGIGASWRKDGKELMIRSADGRSIQVAEVTAGEDFHTGATRQALALPPGTVWVQPTPDFQKFLVATPVGENSTSSLTLVFDWVAALKKK